MEIRPATTSSMLQTQSPTDIPLATQGTSQTTDTLSSCSSCCCQPCSFIGAIYDWIWMACTGIKDWIVSFFYETNGSTPQTTHPIGNSTELYTRSLGMISPLEEVQVTRPIENPVTQTTPASLSKEEMWTKRVDLAKKMEQKKTQTLGVTNYYSELKMSVASLITGQSNERVAEFDTLHEKVRLALEYEFYETNPKHKTPEGFPRVGTNFKECLKADTTKANAIILDVMRSQPSYYMEFGRLGTLENFCEMLQHCQIDSPVAIQDMGAQSLGTDVITVYLGIPEEGRKPIIDQLNEGNKPPKNFKALVKDAVTKGELEAFLTATRKVVLDVLGNKKINAARET